MTTLIHSGQLGATTRAPGVIEIENLNPLVALRTILLLDRLVEVLLYHLTVVSRRRKGKGYPTRCSSTS